MIVNELRNSKTYNSLLEKAKNCTQNNPHHIYDVGKHIEKVAEAAENMIPSDHVLIVAAMLHDIGKPDVKSEKDGKDIFFKHAERSAEIAADLLKIIKDENINKDDYTSILWLVKHHEISNILSEKTLKKYIREVGDINVSRLFILRYCDINGQSDFQKESKLSILKENIQSFINIMTEIEMEVSYREILCTIL